MDKLKPCPFYGGEAAFLGETQSIRSMVEFRACPFCGGEIDGPNFVQCNYGKKIITLGLTCKKCKTGFKFRADFTEDPYTEAREAWNRRVNDD